MKDQLSILDVNAHACSSCGWPFILLLRLGDEESLCRFCWKKTGYSNWRGLRPTRAQIDAAESKMKQPRKSTAPAMVSQ